MQIGINLTVAPTTLNDVWWRLPVLILAAVENGFLEEVLVVGYLLTRLDQLKVTPWIAILISAVLRGSYHLYQGFGGFLGNAVMGVVFAYWFRPTRRLWPLVIAHSLLDITVFVGYSALRGVVELAPLTGDPRQDHSTRRKRTFHPRTSSRLWPVDGAAMRKPLLSAG